MKNLLFIIPIALLSCKTTPDLNDFDTHDDYRFSQDEQRTMLAQAILELNYFSQDKELLSKELELIKNNQTTTQLQWWADKYPKSVCERALEIYLGYERRGQ